MTSAGVMMAKVSWYIANTVSGMLPLTVLTSMPDRKALSKPPYQALSAPGVAERDAVADHHPRERHDAGDREALHEHRQHVLHAHEAGVEQRETGQRHEQDQHRGGEHPRGIRRHPVSAVRRPRRAQRPASAASSKTGTSDSERRVLVIDFLPLDAPRIGAANAPRSRSAPIMSIATGLVKARCASPEGGAGLVMISINALVRTVPGSGPRGECAVCLTGSRKGRPK